MPYYHKDDENLERPLLIAEAGVGIATLEDKNGGHSYVTEEYFKDNYVYIPPGLGAKLKEPEGAERWR